MCYIFLIRYLTRCSPIIIQTIKRNRKLRSKVFNSKVHVTTNEKELDLY